MAFLWAIAKKITFAATPCGEVLARNEGRMGIHREGLRIVLGTVLVSLLLAVAAWYLLAVVLFAVISLVLLGLCLFVCYFFRAPRRLCVESDELVYSPADGRIVAIEEVMEPEVFGDTRIQVSVFMSVWNVHANWYPVSGRVSYARYHKGRFLVAWLPKASTENERSTVVVERPDGQRILFRQIAGAVARRIVTRATVGQAARQGTEYGFIKFGSRVDVFLPRGSEVLVSIGQRVRGTQSPLARV